MDIQSIKSIDKDNMFDVIKSFPIQIEDAVQIAGNVDISNINFGELKNIVVNGLGGSAIGGDFARSFTTYKIDVPIIINRNYLLPSFANSNTLAVISSYSGDTEETNSAYRDAIKRNCKIICISSGGLVGKTANENCHFLLKIPGGLQPRCALGYSFFTLIILLSKLGFIEDLSIEIGAVIELLKRKSDIYSNISSDENPAIKLAKLLIGKLPIIYSSVDILDVVNLRWRGQLSENAKVLAYGNLYPEMNHNELVGWKLNEDILKRIVVIMFKDREDNERIKLRMEITNKILQKYADEIIILKGEGKSKLERIFDLVHLGDWVSYYLAIINKINPTPVEAINFLKNKLAEK
jgi:glucose/mannose-6-phosphate isomerase